MNGESSIIHPHRPERFLDRNESLHADKRDLLSRDKGVTILEIFREKFELKIDLLMIFGLDCETETIVKTPHELVELLTVAFLLLKDHQCDFSLECSALVLEQHKV